MKQGLNSSSTRTYPQQLVVARTSWAIFNLPKFSWITMVIIAMALLCGAAIIRERQGLRDSQTAHQFVKNQVEQAQAGNLLLQKEINSLKQDKKAIEREAQSQLNYVRPNEIVVIVKE